MGKKLKFKVKAKRNLDSDTDYRLKVKVKPIRNLDLDTDCGERPGEMREEYCWKKT